MKKYSFIIVFALVLLVSGCGDNKLICRHSKTDSFYGDNTVSYKLVFDKDNVLKKFTLNSEAVYNKDYIEIAEVDMNAEFESAKEICEMYKDSSNAKCSVNLYKNKKIVIEISFDLDKMTDEEIATFGLTEYKGMTYKEAKENYSKTGFTCK